MTYAQLVAYLEAQALEAGAATFWHGKKTALDINYNAAFPQAHLFLVPSTLRAGRVVHRLNLCFYGKDKHESSEAEVVAIQDAMDRLTQQFVGLLEEDGQGMLSDVERAPTVRQGAQIGTGYFISFTFSTLVLC